MMPTTRREIEVLLDTPDRTNFVVSAFADMTVKDGFRNFADRALRNESRVAQDLLRKAGARKELEDDLAIVQEEIRTHTNESGVRGLAAFVSKPRQLRHVVTLEFPVDNQLVIDKEPYVLPLLERWYGEPVHLAALVDSDRAQLFESHQGVVEPVRNMEREDIDEDIQRDKPRFTYKKRFAQTRHERLHGTDEDKFLQDVAEMIEAHWEGGRFHGLILLGQATLTASLKRLFPRDLHDAVVEQAPQSMTSKRDDVADDVARVIARWHAERDLAVLDELNERWKTRHLVADGPTDVLDALQQGRAAQVIIGTRRDLDGARCQDCNYRFGAPVRICPFCQGHCHPVNAIQEILRMALRHRTPVHLFHRELKSDPLNRSGGVSALLRAEANWAPDPATARATMGHASD